jgi:CRP-like cAMP-binding protein
MSLRPFADALHELSASSRELLLTRGRSLAVSKDEWLLREGQVARGIFYIEAGLVRSVRIEDGRDINLDFSFEGDFVTHLRSLRTQTGANYGLQALEPVSLVELSGDALRELYALSPEIESFGRQLVEELLMRQETQAHLFRLQSPAERYQYVIDHHPALSQRVSLTNLSSYLGISRETLSRIRGGGRIL